MSEKEKQQQVFFNKLDKKEMVTFYQKLLSQTPEFKVWLKDSIQKETLLFESASVQKSLVYLKARSKSNITFVNQEVYCNTFLDGKPFFSKVILDFDIDKKVYFIYLKEGSLYKCERRQNFRLITYFKHNCLVYFPRNQLKREDVIDDSQIIHRPKSNTDILKNFLVERSNADTKIVTKDDDKQQTFKSYDVSVSGVSFIASDYEKEFFSKDQEYENILINFNGEEYIIDRVKVKAIRSFNEGKVKESSLQKIALNFEKISHFADTNLTKQINLELNAVDLVDFI
jgi:hypothetical protein